MDNRQFDADGYIQGLIERISSNPDKYMHLQVFLHRERDTDSRPDNYFLMVSPRVFGKVKVLDLEVEGNFINIEFLDCAMQEVGNVRINISEEKPKVLFICWQDIRKMVLDETVTLDKDELLEFDF
jgi:hypothetical protein